MGQPYPICNKKKSNKDSKPLILSHSIIDCILLGIVQEKKKSCHYQICIFGLIHENFETLTIVWTSVQTIVFSFFPNGAIIIKTQSCLNYLKIYLRKQTDLDGSIMDNLGQIETHSFNYCQH